MNVVRERCVVNRETVEFLVQIWTCIAIAGGLSVKIRLRCSPETPILYMYDVAPIQLAKREALLVFTQPLKKTR